MSLQWDNSQDPAVRQFFCDLCQRRQAPKALAGIEFKPPAPTESKQVVGYIDVVLDDELAEVPRHVCWDCYQALVRMDEAANHDRP